MRFCFESVCAFVSLSDHLTEAPRVAETLLLLRGIFFYHLFLSVKWLLLYIINFHPIQTSLCFQYTVFVNP